MQSKLTLKYQTDQHKITLSVLLRNAIDRTHEKIRVIQKKIIHSTIACQIDIDFSELSWIAMKSQEIFGFFFFF